MARISSTLLVRLAVVQNTFNVQRHTHIPPYPPRLPRRSFPGVASCYRSLNLSSGLPSFARAKFGSRDNAPQTETPGRIGGVAHSCGVNASWELSVAHCASTTRCYVTTPNLAFIVNRAPEPELPPRNRYGYLIEMPMRCWRRASSGEGARANNGPNFKAHRRTVS